MNVRTTRFLLYILSAGFLCGAAASIAWALSAIDTAVKVTSPGRSIAKISPETQESQREDSVVTAAHWQQRLREPLIPPQPKPKPKPRPPVATRLAPTPRIAPPPPQIKIKLIGTILEEGRDVGVFADSSGNIDHKSVGGILDLAPEGIRVEEIEEMTAIVSFEGRQTTLKLQRAGAKKANSRQKRIR